MKLALGTPGDLAVKSKLSPRSAFERDHKDFCMENIKQLINKLDNMVSGFKSVDQVSVYLDILHIITYIDITTI